jgi:hypothetical protein
LAIQFVYIVVEQKQLREVPSDDASAVSVLSTSTLRHVHDDSMAAHFERIRQTPNRTLYLSINMNSVNNPAAHVETLYPIENITNKFSTNQINGITMKMPAVVALYDWNQIPQVSFCSSLFFILIEIIYCNMSSFSPLTHVMSHFSSKGAALQ